MTKWVCVASTVGTAAYAEGIENEVKITDNKNKNRIGIKIDFFLPMQINSKILNY